MSAGGHHHHIGLNAWESEGANRRPAGPAFTLLPVLAAIRRCAVCCAAAMNNSISPSLCRILALTLACAVSTGIAAEKESTDSLTAQQILDKVAATYATCKSYRDSGVVTNDFGPHSAGDNFPRHVDVKPFRTAFVRPDQFRFEYDNPTPEKPYIIWAKGGEVRRWWYIKPDVEKLPSLDLGIAGATGVSSGAAHTIPSLLLPDQIGGAKLSAMIDLTRLLDESLDGTPCFKLHGKYGFGNQPTTLWLEKATFLVRRIAEQSGSNKRTTDYRPEVNKEIPAKELELGAPSTR
jgi:outer membrane lipoprotein-sorting protein